MIMTIETFLDKKILNESIDEIISMEENLVIRAIYYNYGDS